MSEDSPTDEELFHEVHHGNPREGPGDGESTRRAFALLQDLPVAARILDIGCGTGMHTVEIARIIKAGEIIALDNSQDFLDMLEASARQAGVMDRIIPTSGSMFDLRFEKESFDLIWAEGSIFIIGFEKGLRQWRPLLRGKAYMAVTHISWLTANPPDEPKNFWAKHYPQISTIEDNIQIAQSAGYNTIGHFILPQSAWWNDYYTPLEKRVAMLRNKYQRNKAALHKIAETQKEIDLYRHHHDAYGYVFYILRKDD